MNVSSLQSDSSRICTNIANHYYIMSDIRCTYSSGGWGDSYSTFTHPDIHY